MVYAVKGLTVSLGADWFWQQDEWLRKHAEPFDDARKSWSKTTIGDNNYALAA